MQLRPRTKAGYLDSRLPVQPSGFQLEGHGSPRRNGGFRRSTRINIEGQLVLFFVSYGFMRGCTFHLSGTPLKASGRPELSVFWIIAEVIATPQTVPRERIR